METEYPRMLYKGGPVDPNGYDNSNCDALVVEDAEGEAAARTDGYMSLGELCAPKAKARA